MSNRSSNVAFDTNVIPLGAFWGLEPRKCQTKPKVTKNYENEKTNITPIAPNGGYSQLFVIQFYV
jgi:hypothetical protein